MIERARRGVKHVKKILSQLRYVHKKVRALEIVDTQCKIDLVLDKSTQPFNGCRGKRKT